MSGDPRSVETNLRTLLNVLYTTKSHSSCNRMSGNPYYAMGVDCDEVYNNIYIGDMSAAKNKMFLKSLGITHVLNAAEGCKFGMVDTNQQFYRDVGISYLGFPLHDLPMTMISDYFDEACDFIDSGISGGGKVFVNCLMGLSRSSTCVLAYLMIRVGMRAVDALAHVRKYREIRPNDGFLRQLAELDNRLYSERCGRP